METVMEIMSVSKLLIKGLLILLNGLLLKFCCGASYRSREISKVFLLNDLLLLIIGDNPREYRVLGDIMVGSTGESIKLHEILEGGYFVPSPLFIHLRFAVHLGWIECARVFKMGTTGLSHLHESLAHLLLITLS
jgi:hypothetical protein